MAEEFGSFYDGLSDENKASEGAEKFKQFGSDEMFKSYNEVQSLVGKKGIILPNPDDPNDKARFNKEMGVPESADGYELNEIPDWATKAGYDQTTVKNIVFKASLTPAQAKIVEQEYFNDVQLSNERVTKAQTEAKGKADQQLRQEMGAGFEEKMTLKDKFIDTFARSPEAAQALRALADSNPEVAAGFADVGGSFAEHRINGFEPKTFAYSKEEAQNMLSAIRNDPKHAYNNSSASAMDHEAAMAEVVKLETIISKAR